MYLVQQNAASLPEVRTASVLLLLEVNADSAWRLPEVSLPLPVMSIGLSRLPASSDTGQLVALLAVSY